MRTNVRWGEGRFHFNLITASVINLPLLFKLFRRILNRLDCVCGIQKCSLTSCSQTLEKMAWKGNTLGLGIGVGVKSFWCSTTALKKAPSSHPFLWFDGKLNEFRRGEMQKGNCWGGKKEEDLSKESGVVHAEAGSSPLMTAGRGRTSIGGRWVL